MLKCSECSSKELRDYQGVYKPRYICIPLDKVICVGEKLPVTSPRWCPMRLQNRKTIRKLRVPGPNEWD